MKAPSPFVVGSLVRLITGRSDRPELREVHGTVARVYPPTSAQVKHLTDLGKDPADYVFVGIGRPTLYFSLISAGHLIEPFSSADKDLDRARQIAAGHVSTETEIANALKAGAKVEKVPEGAKTEPKKKKTDDFNAMLDGVDF
jgi:hypothetical protein